MTVQAAGREILVEDEDALNQAAGEFFVALLRGLLDYGAFDALPPVTNCYLGVSAVGGGFGWPDWSDRGPENMV